MMPPRTFLTSVSDKPNVLFFAIDFTDFTEKMFKIHENLCNPWLFLSPNLYPKLRFLHCMLPLEGLAWEMGGY